MQTQNRVMHSLQATNLADILERVLDKGVVIAGDIKICLADVELLSIKIRLVIASVDKALAIGINWWQQDPSLNTRAQLNAGSDMAARLEQESTLDLSPPDSGSEERSE